MLLSVVRPPRRALTLVEMTLSLALAAIVVMVAARAYGSAQAARRVHTDSNTLMLVKSAIDSRYSMGGDLVGLDVEKIQTSLPKSLIVTDFNPPLVKS